MTTPGTTVQLTGYVYERRYSWETTSEFQVFGYANMGDEHSTYIGPVQITYTVPADYNPTAQKIAILAAKREQVCREFAASVRAIDEQISKLTAIEYSGSAA